MKRFKLSSNFSPYWVWVRVFDTRDEMVVYSKKVQPEVDHSSALGYFHPYYREKWVNDKWVDASKNTGELVLCKKYLGNTVLSHEVLHCAIWLWRREHRFLRLGEQVTQLEEDFCHLFGDLYAEFIHKMYKSGIY